MKETRKRPPARTPEEEENYMISIAVNAAEKQILSGRASSQLLTHYLKLATVKERLEKEKLEKELARSRGMLSNEKFMSKAPEAKVAEEREKLAKYEAMMEQVEARLASMK